MVVILLGTLLPVWTLICFAIGVSMERGSFGFIPLIRENQKNVDRVRYLERQEQILNEECDKYARQSDRWKKIAEEYQNLYPAPPKAFEYVIKEESDLVAHSMSH